MPRVEQFSLKNIVSGYPVLIDASSITKLSIKDKITPEYNEAIGYGKFDPIMSWKRTSRVVTVDFTINGHNLTQKAIKDFSLITLPKYYNLNYDPVVDDTDIRAMESDGTIPEQPVSEEDLYPTSDAGAVSNTAFVISGAPIYRLNLFGYFDEFGVIKNLSVTPDFDKKTLSFEGRETSVIDGGSFINLLSSNGISKLTYNFQKVQVSFDYVVLHRITPSLEIDSSLNNWPMKR